MKNEAEIHRIRLERTTRNLLELANFLQSASKSQGISSNSTDSLANADISEVSNKQSDNSSAIAENSVSEADVVVGAVAAAKPRAAIVAWDLGHNPAGRALVLYKLLEKDYEVDLIGPLWSRFGRELWEPLRGLNLNVRKFSCHEFMDFVPKAEFFANAITYDLVYVCKPRLPSMFLGTLISLNSGCSLIVDVDDFELSFFPDESYAEYSEIQSDAINALREPYEELATRYCQTLVKHVDGITVSNIALKKRFGGQIVRHAREETLFKYSDELRRQGRDRLKISNDSYVLLFVGTPRPHKGVLEVAKAIYEINDPQIVFHVVGTIHDKRFRNVLAEYDCEQIVYHDNCDFSELPEILAAADLVPLIQDTDHPISQFQIPAKVSDATAMGVTVLSTRTPPLEDLILTGCVRETSERGLKADILECFNDHDSVRRATIRGAFTGELGMEVNRARLKHVINELSHDEKEIDSALIRMISLVRETYALQRGAEICSDSMIQNGIATTTRAIHSVSPPNNVHSLFSSSTVSANHRVIHSKKKKRSLLGRLTGKIGEKQRVAGGKKAVQYDIAFFWKQNDSRIYGRRSDMLAKYLAQSGRVRSLVHFDAPIDAKSIHHHIAESEKNETNGRLSQQQLIIRNLYDRQLHMFDTDNRIDRTFLKTDDNRGVYFPGGFSPKVRSYSEYVLQVLKQNGMRPETTIAWFCPVVWEADTLVNKINFAAVVSDLIDDQRAWAFRNESYSLKLEENYRNTLKHSDLVFANCDSLANAFIDQVDEIHVVPNGAECLADVDLPENNRFEFSSRPVVGYVGNLRDRIDWLLLHKVVAELPDYDFVFMGPSSDSENAISLGKHNNVSFLGVVPYDEMVGYLGKMNVAIVPHLNNHLTAKMNPLKVYNYYAAGLPIVSTDVANLGEFGSRLFRADNPDEFISALRSAVENPIDTTTPEWKETMNSISWIDRVDSIISVMDTKLDGVFSAKSDVENNRKLAHQRVI